MHNIYLIYLEFKKKWKIIYIEVQLLRIYFILCALVFDYKYASISHSCLVSKDFKNGNLLGLVLQVVMGCQIPTGNQTYVFWEIIQYFKKTTSGKKSGKEYCRNYINVIGGIFDQNICMLGILADVILVYAQEIHLHQVFHYPKMSPITLISFSSWPLQPLVIHKVIAHVPSFKAPNDTVYIV